MGDRHTEAGQMRQPVVPGEHVQEMLCSQEREEDVYLLYETVYQKKLNKWIIQMNHLTDWAVGLVTVTVLKILQLKVILM